MIWYYLKGGRQHGPVAEQSIANWLKSGFLSPDDLLWRSGMNDWAPASEIPEFGGQPSPPGGTLAAAPEGVRAYAGFWLRLVAYVIDSVLLGIVLAVYWMPRLPIEATEGDLQSMMQEMQGRPDLMLSAFLLPLIYFTILESSRWQASLGKKLLKLRVTDTGGLRIPWWRAALRRLLFDLILRFTYGIGHILAGFTPRKQGVHDLLARCLVVKE